MGFGRTIDVVGRRRKGGKTTWVRLAGLGDVGWVDRFVRQRLSEAMVSSRCGVLWPACIYARLRVRVLDWMGQATSPGRWPEWFGCRLVVRVYVLATTYMSDHGFAFALWGCSPVVLVILFYGLDMFGMIVDRTRRSTIVVIHRI